MTYEVHIKVWTDVYDGEYGGKIFIGERETYW